MISTVIYDDNSGVTFGTMEGFLYYGLFSDCEATRIDFDEVKIVSLATQISSN